MSNIGVKQGCPLSFIVVGMYIDELETYLDEIDGYSLCLFTKVVVILLYVDNTILLSKSRVDSQRLLNKPYEVCTSSSLEVNLPKTKIMIFGCNKRKLNQYAFYLDTDQIEITQ